MRAEVTGQAGEEEGLQENGLGESGNRKVDNREVKGGGELDERRGSR